MCPVFHRLCAYMAHLVSDPRYRREWQYAARPSQFQQCGKPEKILRKCYCRMRVLQLVLESFLFQQITNRSSVCFLCSCAREFILRQSAPSLSELPGLCLQDVIANCSLHERAARVQERKEASKHLW